MATTHIVAYRREKREEREREREREKRERETREPGVY